MTYHLIFYHGFTGSPEITKDLYRNVFQKEFLCGIHSLCPDV